MNEIIIEKTKVTSIPTLSANNNGGLFSGPTKNIRSMTNGKKQKNLE